MELCPYNPGSRGHPYGCKKPCNKFIQGKTGSCKHGAACNFCHEDHPRPARKSRAERFAENRRQFEQSRDWLDPDTQALFARIYTEPRQHVESAMVTLRDSADPEGQMAVLLSALRMKAVQAEALRPVQLHLPHAHQEGRALLASEVEVKCALQKLEGVLHVAARQWLAAGQESAKISRMIEPILDLTAAVSSMQQNNRSSL